MTAIVTTNLRLKNSSYIKGILSDPANSLYLFISKPTHWADDNYPDTPTDSVLFEQKVRDEMITLRKISPTEVTQSIFRIDWTSGKFYDMYRDDYDGVKLNGVDLDTGVAVTKNGLINANYYVMTDEYNVYKCISNNNRAASTFKPTGTSTSIFSTSDGYVWKFMYSINSADALRFVSTNFIPVQSVSTNPGASSSYYNQYLVQSSAISGRLDVIEIKSAGNGYNPNTSLPVAIIGDGTGATATAVTDNNGQISSVTITNGGSGYTYAIATVTGTSANAAALNCIIPTLGGHGSNPVKELNAVYVTISGSIGEDLSDDTIKDNQYRVSGLILNPHVYGTQSILTSQTANALKSIGISGSISGTFSDDEDLLSIGTPAARGKFVTWASASKTLKYIRNKSNIGPDFAVSQSVTGATSSATGIITSIINPEVDVNSGDLIYVETRRPVYRSISQKEEMRITIET
jgi:hypothetical protein